MTRQKPGQPIRRCIMCQAKTHRRYWQQDICPVCQDMTGAYVNSCHGGLLEQEIQELKKKKKT